ncbi:hypothetical protein [Marinobacterium weihaiense]|uniref:Uncharacterized protein n=1 Tax=Marinobacterium weihaiense TaxID=2851016 RepID=A0ABS6M984_9GAMM|nr:hypothetical protein [Marinobacterium weihaiense]MBV0932449.1 hypothetical protein [Marinobacterium weihaiense]
MRYCLLCLLLLSPTLPASEALDEYAKRFPAKWLERNGTIRLDTLCYNYPGDSYMYRLCRQQAANTFVDRCQRYEAALTRQPDSRHYRRLASKYCTAARQYAPDMAQ